MLWSKHIILSELSNFHVICLYCLKMTPNSLVGNYELKRCSEMSGSFKFLLIEKLNNKMTSLSVFNLRPIYFALYSVISYPIYYHCFNHQNVYESFLSQKMCNFCVNSEKITPFWQNRSKSFYKWKYVFFANYSVFFLLWNLLANIQF